MDWVPVHGAVSTWCWIGATLFPKFHSGMRVETVAANWRFKKNLHAEHPFYWLFDGMHLLIIKHGITAPHGHWMHQMCNQTLHLKAPRNYRWAVYRRKKAPLFPKQLRLDSSVVHEPTVKILQFMRCVELKGLLCTQCKSESLADCSVFQSHEKEMEQSNTVCTEIQCVSAVNCKLEQKLLKYQGQQNHILNKCHVEYRRSGIPALQRPFDKSLEDLWGIYTFNHLRGNKTDSVEIK